jgi:aminoglycoside phosphotransferase (APT) family kinase protein
MSMTWRRAPLLLRERRTHWLHRPERAWTAAVAPTLVARVAAPAADWRTETVIFTSTSVVVATVARPGSARRFVVKVPWTAEGSESLRRHTEVLATLRMDPRLHGLRAILPHCVDRGEIAGRPYCVEEALPGVPATTIVLRRARRAALLRAAARVIGDLHACTREQVLLDDLAVDGWVHSPLRRLEAFAAGRPRHARLIDAVHRLREELMTVLIGRAVETSWIHGDFWPGNLLAAPPGAHVTGVVDWDRAAARQLPLHDLLHLHVFARRVVYGDEFGDVVVRALRDGVAEALGVPATEADTWLGGIPSRPAVLLYWLRHILLFIDSEGHHDNPRWLRGNVERVLANV